MYEPVHSVSWGYNGRNGRGLNDTLVTEAMRNAAVSESIRPLIEEWRYNKRSSRLLATRAYEWYRTHAIPFPGVYIHFYDLHIMDRANGTAVVSIDVSSGGILYVCTLSD